MIKITIKGKPKAQGAYGSYYRISPRRGVKVLDGGDSGDSEESPKEANREWEHLCLAWRKRKKIHKELGIKIPRPGKRVKVQYGKGPDAEVYDAVMMEHIQGKTLESGSEEEYELMKEVEKYFTDSHDGNFIKRKGSIYRVDFGFPPTRRLKKLR